MQSELIHDIKKRKKPLKTINLIIAATLIPAVATKTTNGGRRIGGGSRRK